MITYDTVFQALKDHYEVEEDNCVIEIFCQQSFDEQMSDIAEALQATLNGD